MTPANPRARQLFLVELWREPSAGTTAGSWRGIVKHVGHDNERYVANLTDVTAFVTRCIDAIAPPGDGDSSRTENRTPN